MSSGSQLTRQSRCQFWLSAYVVVAAATGLLTVDERLMAQESQASSSEGTCLPTLPVADLSESEIGVIDIASNEPLLGPVFKSESGITLEPIYYGEAFTNTRGGISTRKAAQYEALLDLPLTLEFQKMNLPVPGRFFLLAQNTHGRGLTNDFIGDFQVVSNIDSSENIMQVSE